MRVWLVLFLLIPFLCKAEDYDKLPFQKDRKYYRLKGAVVHISEKKWVPSKDSVIFNTAAAIMPDNSYTLEHAEETTFDTSGAILTLSISELEDRKKDKMKTTKRYFFYRKNLLAGVSNMEEDKRADSVMFQYRKNGLVEHYALFNDKDKLVYKVTYVYKDDRIFTVRKNNEENFPVSMIKYKYNKDQLMETQHFNDQYQLVEIRRYSMKHMQDGTTSDSYVIMDDKGNIKEGLALIKDKEDRVLERSVVNDKREVTEYNRYTYDEHGYPVEEKIFSMLGEVVIVNKYKYDEQGNWIKKEVYHNNLLQAVVLRDIQYASVGS